MVLSTVVPHAQVSAKATLALLGVLDHAHDTTPGPNGLSGQANALVATAAALLVSNPGADLTEAIEISGFTVSKQQATRLSGNKIGADLARLELLNNSVPLSGTDHIALLAVSNRLNDGGNESVASCLRKNGVLVPALDKLQVLAKQWQILGLLPERAVPGTPPLLTSAQFGAMFNAVSDGSLLRAASEFARTFANVNIEILRPILQQIAASSNPVAMTHLLTEAAGGRFPGAQRNASIHEVHKDSVYLTETAAIIRNAGPIMDAFLQQGMRVRDAGRLVECHAVVLAEYTRQRRPPPADLVASLASLSRAANSESVVTLCRGLKTHPNDCLRTINTLMGMATDPRCAGIDRFLTNLHNHVVEDSKEKQSTIQLSGYYNEIEVAAELLKIPNLGARVELSSGEGGRYDIAIFPSSGATVTGMEIKSSWVALKDKIYSRHAGEEGQVNALCRYAQGERVTLALCIGDLERAAKRPEAAQVVGLIVAECAERGYPEPMFTSPYRMIRVAAGSLPLSELFTSASDLLQPGVLGNSGAASPATPRTVQGGKGAPAR